MATPQLNILTAPHTGVAVDVSKLTSPDIELAKNGVVGRCFDAVVPVNTGIDAAFVKYDSAVPHDIRPDIDIFTAMQFCTLEQAAALTLLIEKLYPGSSLTLYDNADFFAIPGFRKLAYLNAGGLYSPRVYKITGMVRWKGEDRIIEIQVGRMLGGERYWQYTGMPPGNDTIGLIEVAGMPRMVWCGKATQ